MPQTKTKAGKKPNSEPAASANGVRPVSDDVLTLADAATYLRVTESELLQLVNDQALPGRQIGTQWRFLKSAIQDWLRTPPMPGSRDAVLSTAGSWKDDPLVEAELAEIYRKRRENLVEEIQ